MLYGIGICQFYLAGLTLFRHGGNRIGFVWEWVPFVVLFVIAALDHKWSPFEAARIDGASFWQELWYLTLPLIKPILSMVLVFRVVEGLKIFPLVFSLTQGGPGNSPKNLLTLHIQKAL